MASSPRGRGLPLSRRMAAASCCWARGFTGVPDQQWEPCSCLAVQEGVFSFRMPYTIKRGKTCGPRKLRFPVTAPSFPTPHLSPVPSPLRCPLGSAVPREVHNTSLQLRPADMLRPVSRLHVAWPRPAAPLQVTWHPAGSTGPAFPPGGTFHPGPWERGGHGQEAGAPGRRL